MKLWQKIFLCTLGLVMLGFNVITMILLNNQHKLLLEQSQKSAMSAHEYVVTNVKNMILYERLKQNVIVFKEEEVFKIIVDLFQTDVEEESYNTIDLNGLSLYADKSCRYRNGKQFDSFANQLLERGIDQEFYYIETIDQNDSKDMVVASSVALEGRSYLLVTSYDANDIYDLYDQQLEFIKQVSIYSGFIIAGILLFVIRFLLLPLQELNYGTRQIAKGNYKTRINIKRKDELSELARNMNFMAEAIEKNVNSLESVAKARKDFIDNLSHEMKTPLTSILGFSQLLSINKNITEEERLEYSRIIMDEAKRMKILSGKLMEMISLENTEFDFREEDVKELLDETAAVFFVMMEKDGIHLDVEIEAGTVYVDKELFKSLLYNLLDNAKKASKAGDTINMKAQFRNGIVEITVSDHGIGMSQEDLKKVTEPFYMVDKSRSRKSQGAGLGLALCAEIAKVHDAVLTFESELGAGTTAKIQMKGRKKDGTI